MNGMDFRVSVVVTSYNQKAYLVECLESVIRQTVKPYEIIIADDCSNDGSEKVIRGYVEKYPSWIRAVFQPARVFIPKNRNAGLREVQGNYVMILDGDDRLLPQNLELQKEALAKHPNAGCVYTNLFLIHDTGERSGIRDKDAQPFGPIFPDIAAGKMGILRSMVARTDLVQEAGGMDEKFPHYDGYILTLRLARLTEFAYVAEPAAEYRVHRGTSSMLTPGELYRNLEAVYAEVLKNIGHLSFEVQDRIKKAWVALLCRRRVPKLSVITPVYQGAAFVEACLKNVIEQNCDSVEHILIEGSEDKATVDILTRYAERYGHIRWVSEKDKGQSDAMNKGIRMSRGDILGFLNVDDAYESGVLNRALQVFEKLEPSSIVTGHLKVWDEHGKLKFVSKPTPKDLTLFNALFFEKNPLPNPAAYFYHKSIHCLIGDYDVKLPIGMDLDFILRALPAAKSIVCVQELWGHFRFHPGCKTYRSDREGFRLGLARSIRRRYEKNLSWPERLALTKKRVRLSAGLLGVLSFGGRLRPRRN